jgi:RimJ/RimL family protein N-acetyltransferase
VAWRLRRDVWGHGYATEGGRIALDYTFGELGLADVVSFTPAINLQSRQVLERLGMSHVSDFDRPGIAPEDQLDSYVLYKRSVPSP